MAEGASETPELLRLRIHGGRRFVGAVSSAAAGVAEGLDFGRDDVERVRSVVGSLCHDVIESHFDDPRDADFTLIVRERRGALTVRIEDEGLPYPVDRFSLDGQTLVGRRHTEGWADALRLESRGAGGNALELTLRRSALDQTQLEHEEDPGTTPVDADAPITVRALTAADAPSLARCVYRCYRYTYSNDFIYYPDQVLSLIERDLLRSFVGVNPDGEVVGHCGIIRDHPDARVAESGMAVVDPRYRNHHLLGAIKSHQVEAVRELDLVGTYADAVAVHPITQKANVAIGARETGLLLAEIPEFTRFRGFDDEPCQRGSVVVYYHPTGEAPPRESFPPPRYRALLESIYRKLGLRRTLSEPKPSGASARTSVHVEVKGRRGLARIEVESAGCDLVAEVCQRFRELCLQRLDVIHLDLLLGDPTAMAAVDDLCELGFFFGAAIPELHGGDILRLQYLNNVALDPDRLVLYTDEAKRLLEGILADRAQP
jgi:serine/threonine-protein kinase RsbW